MASLEPNPLSQSPRTSNASTVNPSRDGPPRTSHSYPDLEKEVTASAANPDGVAGDEEFDPFKEANPYSPFYLYYHDSPRASADLAQAQSRPKDAVRVSLRDVEAASTLSEIAQSAMVEKRRDENKIIHLWARLRSVAARPKDERHGRMTHPKQQSCAWFHALPRWQRIVIKISILLVFVGAIVGIAVGISLKVGGGVYKNSNQQTPIGH